MTVSFHKYTGDFFPGTGKLDDNGSGPGKYYSINVPLQDGIDDAMYLDTFKTVIGETVACYRPTAIVIQCGADSLGLDRLGAFNLSIAAHGECVNFVHKFNLPLLVLGGGGYNIKNVSRCWTYETAVLVGAEIPDELPATVYDSFFQDSQWKLHPPLTGKVDNQNSQAALTRITTSIRQKLRYLQGAPSVALQEIPPDIQGFLADESRTTEEKDEDISTALAGERRSDVTTARNEFFDGEDDVDHEVNVGGARGKTVTTAPKRARGTRRGRGRGKTRGGTGTTHEEGDEESDDAPAPSRRRGRGRGRGRKGKAVEKDKDSSTPDADAPNEMHVVMDD